jgi:uncharacterized protein YjbI with pentapeptide repeats
MLWNVDHANMAGVLTEQPVGQDVSAMPYGEMLEAHALWCETGGAKGRPSAFNNADLRALKSIKGLNLTALSAREAVFYGLDMEGVQLQGAHLQGADLRSCNLRRADLRGARLAGAKLSGSDLREVHLGPLLIRQDHVLPSDLTGAVLKGVDLSGADLRRVVFRGADLERARFNGANVRMTDFEGASLASVKGLQRQD